MRKFAKWMLLALLLTTEALGVAGCSAQQKPSSNPLVAKWLLKYDGDLSQVLFNIEDTGEMDVVIWHWDDAEETYVQAEDYYGRWTQDAENGTLTYQVQDTVYEMEYVLEESASLTITYLDHQFTLNYVEANLAEE